MNFAKNYTNNGTTETIHVFEKNRQLCTSKPPTEKTFDESPINWDNNLESITPLEKNEGKSISYHQALDYFNGADLSEYNNGQISTRVKKFGNMFACFSNLTKCKLKEEYINDYNLLFLIAKCPYQKYNKIHEGMLRTVYNSLVANKYLEFSWENIGFQSNLPWTDLRGVGMFGALQLLYISTLHPILSNMLYELSTIESNTFPFAVVSLNITRIILNLLRHDKLNREINKEEEVFVFTNKLYAAIFYDFGQIWINEKKTIFNIGNVIEDVEKSCLSKRTRKKILKNLERENIFLFDDHRLRPHNKTQ